VGQLSGWKVLEGQAKGQWARGLMRLLQLGNTRSLEAHTSNLWFDKRVPGEGRAKQRMPAASGGSTLDKRWQDPGLDWLIEVGAKTVTDEIPRPVSRKIGVPPGPHVCQGVRDPPSSSHPLSLFEVGADSGSQQTWSRLGAGAAGRRLG